MDKIYRTLRWHEKLKDEPLKFPICVPTYNRPHFGIMNIIEKEPDLPIVLFIRKEQEDMYDYLQGKCKIVKLKGMENVGQTRDAICIWAQSKGIDDIFMFDDRVTEVNFLAPRKSRTGNLSLVKASKTMKEGLQIWEYLVSKYQPCVSGAAHKGYSWSPSYINAKPARYSKECQIAIHISVKQLVDNGIRYRDCKECGSEDATLSFDVMCKKLEYIVFTDLEYNNIPSSNNNGGGIQAAEGREQETRIERFDRFNELLKKNVFKGHPGMSFRKAEGGVTYAKFNWKYWKEFYAQIQRGE